MPSAGPRRSIAELTYQEVAQTLGPHSVLILPVGSIEQHGPHLPLNTDVLIAEALAARMIARWGDALDLWQLPTVSVSLAREHEWAAGTLSLSVEGMSALIRDLGRTVRRSLPTRNLLILNGHGGNRGILEAVIRDLRADVGLNVCVFHPAALSDGLREGRVPEIHAGLDETSLMLAIAPHLVRRENISESGKNLNSERIATKILDPSIMWPWMSDDQKLAAAGVIGDPSEATAERGERLIAAAVEAGGKIVRALIDESGE